MNERHFLRRVIAHSTLFFFQVRNLSELPVTKKQLVDCGLLHSLVYFLKLFPRDTELALNICRILSKMTLCSDVCTHLLDYDQGAGAEESDDLFASLFALLTTHVQKADLVVRVLFILGNLTAKSDEARGRLWLLRSKEGSSLETAPVKILVSTFLNYVNLMNDDPTKEKAGGGGGEPNKVEDVLIKLVRYKMRV